jgi:hypothetical protein
MYECTYSPVVAPTTFAGSWPHVLRLNAVLNKQAMRSGRVENQAN